MSGINPYSFLTGWGNIASGSAYPVQQAQITALPQNLSQLKQPVQIKGEISTQNIDGTTLIKTPQGDLTVKLTSPLPTGTKIDLQIPAGLSPKETFIQPTLIKSLDGNNGQNTVAKPSPEVIVTSKSQTYAQTPNTEVKNLQTTTQQASQNLAQRGDANTPLPLQTGQAIRITPLPASLQTLPAIAREFTQTPQTQIQTVLNPKLAISTAESLAPSRRSQSLPANGLASPMLFNMRKSLLPPTLNYSVSGDRTLRPMITQLNLSQPLAGQPMRIDANAVSLPSRALLPFGQPADSRVSNIIEPMHIRPPTVPNLAVTMSSTMSAAHNQTFPNMTLLNSFAGESIAISTGFVTESGNPILQVLLPASQTQMVSINYPSRNLPEGTQITLRPIAQEGRGQMPNFASNVNPTKEIIEKLLSALPQLQVQQMMDILPSATNSRQFPAAALLFLAAAQGGDLSAWMGKRHTRTIETIQQPNVKNDIQKLLSDLLKSGGGNERKATSSDPMPVQTGDWRGHQIPLLTGMDLQAATLWVRDQESSRSPHDKHSQSTRFIVDLHLSRMGAVQFDGLVTPSRQTLDLSFITQRELAKPMQDNLKTLWYKTLENLGYSGSIAFRRNQ